MLAEDHFLDSGPDGDLSRGRVSLSEENLFAEKKDAIGHIKTIVDPDASVAAKDESLCCLRKIFDNYLECPTLLDRHVETMVTELMEFSRRTINVDKTDELRQLNHPLSAIYALSKVRGRKSVQKCLSHEVEDIEPVLGALQVLAGKDGKKIANVDEKCIQDNSGRPQLWESHYVLWNWLGTLSLVPFDCRVVLADSQLIPSLVELGKQHLSETGPTREAAAACLASWLSRRDLEKSQLPVFVNWSREIVEKSCRPQKSRQCDIFLILGVIQTLVTIIKVFKSSRDNILEIMQPLWDTFIKLAESSVCDSNLLLRKLMIKWWTRMGCLYLPPRIASWRYQRGRRSLAQNLQKVQYQQSENAGAGGPTQSDDNITPGPCCCEEDILLPDVPDQVEDAMGYVIQGLTDRSTPVRWSAAKGVGRLTERLPSICADDVLDAVLELFADLEKDQAFHGACLSLAELARRGLLLPKRLGEVVPLIVRAIQVC